MMKKNDEFFVGYLDEVGPTTRKKLKRFVWTVLLLVFVGAGIFALSQKPFANSTFELTKTTQLTGVYHESPYPMLRIDIGDGLQKDVLLVGFGKSSVAPFLEKIREEQRFIQNKTLNIEGNLIYYNGKTVMQVTSDKNVTVENELESIIPSEEHIGTRTFEGEIIDPKCYFGVMKPGEGKIHRSCAVRCISGGIPPVLLNLNSKTGPRYLLLTDADGNPIHDAVLKHVGKPLRISGDIVKKGDWFLLKMDPNSVSYTGSPSIYSENISCQSDCAHLHLKEAFARSE